MGMQTDERIHLFADYTLDLARGCLLSGDRAVHLRPQAYEVLRHLAQNRGRLIGKDTLIENIWRGRAVTDDALVQCLIEIRHALGADGKRYVRNVRGRGYLFDPTPDHVISWIPDTPGPNGFSEGAPAPAAATSVKNTARDKLVAGSIYLLVIFVVLAAIGFLKFSGNRTTEISSIAVLPFVNADSNLDYFSDGLCEMLIDRLSQLPDVKVIARNSSFKYKGREVNPPEVAGSLGVQALVTGEVVQRGQDLEVRVELVNARDGTHIWGARYNRRLAEMQIMQEEIARAISEKVSQRLSGEQVQQLTKHVTENSQAYQLYLSGLFYRRRGGIENSRKALEYYNQALGLDPKFALAWAGVGEVHVYFANDGFSDPKTALNTAKGAAEKALALDDSLAEAHLVQAELKKAQWQWSEADREFNRAIQLNPNSVEAHHGYARYLSPMGRHAEALAENQRAQELDPLRTSLKAAEATNLLLARRYDEALEKLQQAIKSEPGGGGRDLMLGMIYQTKGMYTQSIEHFEKALTSEGESAWRQIMLGYSLARSGKKHEAEAILRTLKKSNTYVSPAELAILCVGLEDNDEAIALLEKSYAERDLQLQYLRVVSQYDPLRSDPRFQDILRRISFPS